MIDLLGEDVLGGLSGKAMDIGIALFPDSTAEVPALSNEIGTEVDACVTIV